MTVPMMSSRVLWYRVAGLMTLATTVGACSDTPVDPTPNTPTDSVPTDTLPATDLGSWSSGPALPEPLQEIYAVEVGGFAYVVGGIDAESDPSDRAYRLNLATSTWSRIADLPSARHHVPLAAIGDSVYAVGGTRSPPGWDVDENPWVPFIPTGTLWMYHEGTGTWKERAPLPAPRGASAVAALDGKIYVAGGQSRRAETLEDHENLANLADSLLIYDPALDQWSTGAPIPQKRDHVSGVAIGGLFYAIGGRQLLLATATRRVDVYDPATDIWSSAPPMGEVHAGFAAVVLDGAIHVFGGETNERSLVEHERYDPDVGAWENLRPLPSGIHGNAGAVHDGRIYSIGGGPLPGFSQANEVQVYTPPGSG